MSINVILKNISEKPFNLTGTPLRIEMRSGKNPFTKDSK